jgi:hypothetical protein
MKKIVLWVFCAAIALTFIAAAHLEAGDQGKAKVLSNTFKEQSLGYRMSYPGDWVYTFQAPHIVVFSARNGAVGEATISIRNLNSTLVPGGKYKDIDSVMDSLLNQLKTTKNVMVYNPEPYEYSKGQTKLTGKQVVTEYTLQGEKYKQWVVVLQRPAGDVFHLWSFVSQAKTYEHYLSTAKAMLSSLTIQ